MAPFQQSDPPAEALFNQISETYEDAYGNNAVLNKALDQLSDYVGHGATVLDVGCGPGGPASYLAEKGFAVTGFDVSGNMIDFCKANIKGKFYKSNMLTFEPETQFDAVIVMFSMLQMSYRNIHSMLFKIASWLRPGGAFIVGTVPAEDYVKDLTQLKRPDGYVEQYDVPFMGRTAKITMLSTRGWLKLIQETGMWVQDLERCAFQPQGPWPKENQLFVTAQKMSLDPLFGPYPLPAIRRPAHALSQGAWQPFVERLTRHEFDAVLDVVAANKKVLDVGSGLGELPISIANMLGKAYTIESNEDKAKLSTESSIHNKSNVEVRHGKAEKLPYQDDSFDAVVALWVLHYVDDLEQSLTEMTRVANAADRNAKLVIVQGAPDNEVVNLINKACVPLAGHPIDHQGLLLATAARVFTRHGFGDITLARVDARCNFPEPDVEERCEKAAQVLTDFWYLGHPRADEMRAALRLLLREHFQDREFEVDDQAVMLVARPSTAS